METARVRDRRKKTLDAFQDEEVSVTAAPIPFYNNSNITYMNDTIIGDGKSSNANTPDTSEMVWTFLGPILLLLLCMLSHRRNVPSTQYHRGAMFRRQAERVWAIQREKDKRQAIPLEKRKCQIDENLRKMKIVSKCDQTGHCILGPIGMESEQIYKDEDAKDVAIGEDPEANYTDGSGDTEKSSSTSSENIESTNDSNSVVTEDDVLSAVVNTNSTTAASVAAAPSNGPKCPESPGAIERRPLLSRNSEDSEDNVGNSCGSQEPKKTPSDGKAVDYTCYDGFDDDEDVCPICLDNFEVGDVVMWSRHGSCSHVFHEDCLLQWLLEQRENECPTCRACFIADMDADSTSSSTDTADTSDNSIIEIDETESNLDERISDIEEGSNTIGGNDTSSVSTRENCDSHLDEMQGQDRNFDDEIEQNERCKTYDIEHAEEGKKYIIVKGCVQELSS